MEKYKKYIPFILILISFMIISVLSIYSAEALIGGSNYFIKQIIWYFVGFSVILLIWFIGPSFFIKYSFIFYFIFNFLLLLLLFFGTPINDARCWFSIPGIGTFQPSEFMKIILILVLTKILNEFNEKYTVKTVKLEFLLLLKVGLIVFIPCILTFLEPDTVNVLIYLLITFIMLFISGIHIRFFVIFFSFLIVMVISFLIFYFKFQNTFVNIFGSSFFLRIDRIINWSSKSGFQLEHGLYSIGSAGLLGHGFTNTPLYFPEANTDFIFAIFASNFGFIGSFILITLFIYFNIKLIKLSLKTDKYAYKLFLFGMIGMLIYQEFQNIGMTVGILPITGITLPFISYGGSSLLCYMFLIGIVFGIIKEGRSLCKN